jgi:hypothetical protein
MAGRFPGAAEFGATKPVRTEKLSAARRLCRHRRPELAHHAPIGQPWQNGFPAPIAAVRNEQFQPPARLGRFGPDILDQRFRLLRRKDRPPPGRDPPWSGSSNRHCRAARRTLRRCRRGWKPRSRASRTIRRPPGPAPRAWRRRAFACPVTPPSPFRLRQPAAQVLSSARASDGSMIGTPPRTG